MDAVHYFSPDYPAARDRFRTTALQAGAALHAIDLDARGPLGEALTIDIAWLGATDARGVLLHTSGLHGDEAFAGSAIQLALLEEPPQLPADGAMVLVHVLNPFGMAWLRRANENNVDLNRNFLIDGESWSGAPEIYARIDGVLNPRSAPSRDFFYLRALFQTLRHGFGPLEQAVAQGQYEFARGLFFGGHRLEQGPQRYLAWLAGHLAHARYVFALDVHTGLGPWADDTLLLEAGAGATPQAELGRALDREPIDVTNDPRVAYRIRGGMGARLPRLLGAARLDFVLQELGTYPPITVFHALREENRWHHYGAGALDHPAKRRLLECLCPAAPAWRTAAIARGLAIARAAATLVGTRLISSF
jgi:hypothetical protein